MGDSNARRVAESISKENDVMTVAIVHFIVLNALAIYGTYQLAFQLGCRIVENLHKRQLRK